MDAGEAAKRRMNAEEEVIQEAVSKGIGLISITDDDTMDAYVRLEEIAIKYAVILRFRHLTNRVN